MALKCSGIFGMIFLIIINMIFFPLGLSLLIAGALALSNVADVNTGHLSSLLDAVKEGSIHVGNMATSLFILFIVVGAFILMVSGLGLLGACCQNKCMLVLYAVLILVLLVMKIIILALWFTMKEKVESDIKAKMLANLISDFKDDTITSDNSVSNAWNRMFMKLECCAVNDVLGTTNDFDTTTWCTTSGSCQETNSQIPKTCCLNVDEYNYSSAPSGCHASVQSGTYNSKGCYDALKDKLLSQTTSIMGVTITIIVLEILAIILAFVVCSQAGDKISGLSDGAKSF